MKTSITILNIIAALPLVAYPLMLFGTIFLFDNPNFKPWILIACFTGYPIIIIALIYFSRRYDSILLAILALIPLLMMIYFFKDSFGNNNNGAKEGFNSAQKDFVCDKNSFISLKKLEDASDDSRRQLYLYEKKGLFSFNEKFLGTVFDSKKVNWALGSEKKVGLCKNNDGKSPLDLYTDFSKMH